MGAARCPEAFVRARRVRNVPEYLVALSQITAVACSGFEPDERKKPARRPVWLAEGKRIAVCGGNAHKSVSAERGGPSAADAAVGLGLVAPNAASWRTHSPVGLDRESIGRPVFRCRLNAGRNTRAVDGCVWVLDPVALNREAKSRHGRGHPYIGGGSSAAA